MTMYRSIFIIVLVGAALASSRTKRFLTFVPTSPTRTQLLVGIGIPFDSDEEVSVISGWILKAEYWLYTNSTDLRPVYFPGIFDVNGIGPLNSFGRKRRDVDPEEFEDGGADYNYGEEETIVPERTQPEDNQLMDGETTRWLFYKSLETWATHKGLAGRPCVLRAICESAQVPFTYENGLLGELMHILMTPSTSMDKARGSTDNEYWRAEVLGRQSEPCDRIFHECNNSLLDIFSKIYDASPMEAILRAFG